MYTCFCWKRRFLGCGQLHSTCWLLAPSKNTQADSKSFIWP